MNDLNIKQVEELHMRLQKNPALTEKELATLSSIVSLIMKEDEECEGYSNATRSRRNNARALLASISFHIGIEALFLCTLTFSITQLGTTRKKSRKFISGLQSWKQNTNTESIHKLADSHLLPYYENLLEIGKLQLNLPMQDAYLYLVNPDTSKHKRRKRTLSPEDNSVSAKRLCHGIQNHTISNRQQDETPHESAVRNGKLTIWKSANT